MAMVLVKYSLKYFVPVIEVCTGHTNMTTFLKGLLSNLLKTNIEFLITQKISGLICHPINASKKKTLVP